MAPPRSCLAAAVVVGLLHPANYHWAHIGAVYADLPGFFVQRAVGAALGSLARPGVAFHEWSCPKEPRIFEGPGVPALGAWPVVIRGAFNASEGAEKMLRFFSGQHQTQFPPCAEERPLALGREAAPCLDAPFEERVTRLDPSHRAHKPWAVFTQVLNESEMLRHSDMLVGLGTPVALTRQGSVASTRPHVTVVLTGEESSVPYFHAHGDFFMVWNIAGDKKRQMLPPSYLPSAAAMWSGLSFMALKAPKTDCLVETVQRPGDVLYVPTFWLHRTELERGETHLGNVRHVGYSQHFGSPASLPGHLVSALEFFFGPAFGYRYLDMLAPSESKQSAVEAWLQTS